MLNSAAGVTLPISNPAPPMTTKLADPGGDLGRLDQRHRDVGQRPERAQRDRPRLGCTQRVDQESRRRAAPATALPARANSASRRARRREWLRPVRAGAASAARTRRKPGGPGRPASSQTGAQLRSVCASGRLPATATSPSTSSSSGEASANRIATASSMPGSVSMMTGRGMLREAWDSLDLDRRTVLRVCRSRAQATTVALGPGLPCARRRPAVRIAKSRNYPINSGKRFHRVCALTAGGRGAAGRMSNLMRLLTGSAAALVLLSSAAAARSRRRRPRARPICR